MSKIVFLQGKEIEQKSVQDKIDQINNSRVPIFSRRTVNNSNFKITYEDNQFCVLGSDWFMIYTVDETKVLIDYIESFKSQKNAFNRALEMLKAFKEILARYSSHHFIACLNHNSKQLYDLGLKSGAIIEISKEYSFDDFVDVEFKVNK